MANGSDIWWANYFTEINDVVSILKSPRQHAEHCLEVDFYECLQTVVKGIMQFKYNLSVLTESQSFV